MSTVPARIAKGRGDGFGLSMAEIARHVGVTTSSIAKAVARLEGDYGDRVLKQLDRSIDVINLE